MIVKAKGLEGMILFRNCHILELVVMLIDREVLITVFLSDHLTWFIPYFYLIEFCVSPNYLFSTSGCFVSGFCSHLHRFPWCLASPDLQFILRLSLMTTNVTFLSFSGWKEPNINIKYMVKYGKSQSTALRAWHITWQAGHVTHLLGHVMCYAI